jgi:hypothetical protein
VGAATGLRPAPLLAGVAAAGVLVATVMTGPDAGAEVRTGQISVDYSCRLPTSTGTGTGAQRLSATLTQDYPVTASAGSAIQPGPLTVETTLPRHLLPPTATGVTGTATLGVAVSDGGGTVAAPAGPAAPAAPSAPAALPDSSASASASASASGTTVTLRTSAAAAAEAATAAVAVPAGARLDEWDGLTVAPVRLGPGDPTLTASGQVPALTAGRAGSTTTVLPLTLALSLRAGGETLPLACTATSPPVPLGSVSVVGLPSTAARASAAASPDATPGRDQPRRLSERPQTCAASPSGQIDPAYLPTPPPGATITKVTNYGVQCAYAIGYANVGKLGEASLVNSPKRNPTFAVLSIVREVTQFTQAQPYIELDEVGNLNLPPAATDFLTYGFIPTTAMMQLTAQGPLTAVETGYSPPEQVVTTISGKQTLRLYDVKVDGTPLDVGSDCRTVTPLKLSLVGTDNAAFPYDVPSRDYMITTGGPLSQDNLVIPYFTGCGPGGSLDPLFDAAVSGSGNSLNLMQGPVCFTFGGVACTAITMPELPVRAPKTSK